MKRRGVEVNLYNKLKSKAFELIKRREFVLITVFFALFLLLIIECFQLQIIDGQSYLDDYTLSIQKTREVTGTRGNIYDRNGEIIAYNKLSYDITIEDNGEYEKKSEKNAAINNVIEDVMVIVEDNGDTIINNFGVVVNSEDEYEYVATSETSKLRFIADVYGKAQIDDLSNDQKNATPDDIITYLCTDDIYGYGLSLEDFTKSELLKYVNIRYAMNLNSYRKYIPTSVAENVSDETVAAIMENADSLQGVSVEETSIREYVDSEYFAPIIGYTGLISLEEYEALQEEGKEEYTKTDVIGKSGLEKTLDSYLQGSKGEERIYVNSVGRVTDTVSTIDAKVGNDVYLTIDSNLQKLCYDLLEEKLAGILLAKIQNVMEYNPEYVKSTTDIIVPIGDVYNAFIGNEILDVSHFEDENAGPTEQAVLASYEVKKAADIESVMNYLMNPDAVAHEKLSSKDQEYITYVSATLLRDTLGIVDKDLINTEDEIYQQWFEGKINFYSYITYAIEQNWIDTARLDQYLDTSNKYVDSAEVLQSILSIVEKKLNPDGGFQKLIYKNMILNYELTGTQISLMLFEQNLLPFNQTTYDNLKSGAITSYDFITSKIRNLEITPGQLGLEPSTGSAVVTDPNTGDVLAMVSYPGYDNNRLANQIDSDYFNKLVNDTASPFYNHATLEKTAPGSTFKMVSSVAGVSEGVMTVDTIVHGGGVFEKVTPNPKCWIHPHSHGSMTLSTALQNSCNIYFYELGYRLSLEDRTLIGTDDKLGSTTQNMYSSDLGTQTLAEYAKYFGLDEKSGVEIPESMPEISDTASVPSAIGQGTHNYTTSQLAKYVGAVANKGDLYDLTLIDKVTDVEGNIVEEFEPKKVDNSGIVQIPSSVWSTVHYGMELMVNNSSTFDSLSNSIELAGKTGTAQQSKVNPDHALFVGFTPIDNPEIALAVRIANGYTSAYAAEVGRDITSYYSQTETVDSLIKGEAATLGRNTSGD